MTCHKPGCSYGKPHLHRDQWIRQTVICERCKCGRHSRCFTVAALMRVWR